jgi:hypothetical protein
VLFANLTMNILKCLTSPSLSPKEKNKLIESIKCGCMSIFCF